MVNIDPSGLDVVGLTFGYSHAGSSFFAWGISGTFAIDTNLETRFVTTPEIGGGTPGSSGFIRVVWGVNDNHNVDSLLGPGTSVSPNFGRASTSTTWPGSDSIDSFPLIEFGIHTGETGATITEGYGMTWDQTKEVLGMFIEVFDFLFLPD